MPWEPGHLLVGAGIFAALLAVLVLGIWTLLEGPGDSPAGLLAKKLGLVWKPSLLHGAFEGRFGGVTVRLRDGRSYGHARHLAGRHRRDGLQMEIPTVTRIGLAFRAEPRGLDAVFADEDVITGDPAFDGAVHLGAAHPAIALAIADSATREDMRAAAERFEAHADGSVIRGFALTGTEMEEAAQRLARIADRVRRFRSTPEALAANARREPLATVRFRNLECLLEHYPDWEGTTAVARALLESDPDAEIRVLAARVVGRTGSADTGQAGRAQTTLVAIARDGDAPAEARERALREALESLTPEDAHEVLPACIDMRAPALCLLALRHCEAIGWRPPDAEKLRLLATESWEKPVRAAALRLLDAEDPASARVLLVALDGADAPGRRAAALALGETGSIDAVERLLPLSQGMLGDASVREAAAGAIRRIQERARGAAGTLALATPDGRGELALEGQRQGAVAVVPKSRR